MSRDKTDHYVTPPEIARWAVSHAAEIYHQYKRPAKVGEVIGADFLKFFEPGCGKTMPFSKAAVELGCLNVDATDILDLSDIEVPSGVSLRPNVDFMSDNIGSFSYEKYDLIATNPPFKLGIDFILKSMTMLAENGVMSVLPKMSFMNTQGRYNFFRDNPPAEVHVLSKRPSFTGGHGTDAQEYALYFWVGSSISRKIRKKYGRRTLLRWQDNKQWN